MGRCALSYLICLIVEVNLELQTKNWFLLSEKLPFRKWNYYLLLLKETIIRHLSIRDFT